MNVVIVGGSGYVGGAVTDLLAQASHNFRVYDALLYEESYRKPVEFIFGDIRDTNRLRPHLEWADAVVWLAALVGDGACALNPDVSVAINQNAVRELAQCFDGRIIFTSTCSVYGAQDSVLDETSPTNPLSVYASTKLEAEQHLKNENAMILRLGTLFGVGDLFSRIRLDLVVNTLAVRAHQHGKVSVLGGDQCRPLLHVRDIAQVIVDNLETPHQGVFNLHRQNVRIGDLANQLRNHFPDLEIETTAMNFQDTRNYRVSSDKAQKSFNFRPVYSIDDGIEEIKELLNTRRLKDFENPRYTNQTFLSLFNTHAQSPAEATTDV